MRVPPLERNVSVALFEVTGELVCWLLRCFVANGSANWILAPWRCEKEVVGGGQAVLIGWFFRILYIHTYIYIYRMIMIGYFRILSESLGLYWLVLIDFVCPHFDYHDFDMWWQLRWKSDWRWWNRTACSSKGPWCPSIYFEEFRNFMNSTDLCVCVFMDVMLFDQGDASLWPAGRVQPACWTFYMI